MNKLYLKKAGRGDFFILYTQDTATREIIPLETFSKKVTFNHVYAIALCRYGCKKLRLLF